jgi:membrane protease YdiL (CAAX protease family)
LVVFLVAVLAWIGFEMTLRAGLLTVAAIPPWLGIALDSALRLLPALIAIGLLFRRPSHAVRVLGLTKMPSWLLVFGMFSLLSWLGQGTTVLFSGMSPTDPAGGLSSGEAGPWGLAFAVISACMMAPIAEEIVYRGVLFRSLWNRFGVLPAAILSSGAFALVHFYNITGLVGVALFGFVCALVYSKTRALSTVIALHCLYNLAVKLPEWLVYHAPLQ